MKRLKCNHLANDFSGSLAIADKPYSAHNTLNVPFARNSIIGAGAFGHRGDAYRALGLCRCPLASEIIVSELEASTKGAVVKDYLKPGPDGLIDADPLDLLYAMSQNDLRSNYYGKEVEVTGQWIVENQPNGNAPPYKVAAVPCNPPGINPPREFGPFVDPGRAVIIPAFTWVKVIGTITFPLSKDGERRAVIRAKIIRLIDKP